MDVRARRMLGEDFVADKQTRYKKCPTLDLDDLLSKSTYLHATYSFICSFFNQFTHVYLNAVLHKTCD